MKKMNKKTLVLLIAIAALMTASIGGTVAWLATSSGPIVNTFEPTEAKVTVTDDVVGNVKQNVVITNNSDFPGYIRAAIVANWYDKDGNIVAPWTGSVTINTTKWMEIGGYYYYVDPVPSKTATPVKLFESYTATGGPAGAHLEMDIIAQVIQATPKQAVIDAWGQSVADQLNDQQN